MASTLRDMTLTNPTTRSEIVWPRPAMAGCIFCTIIRDTRGIALDHAERFNFFPSSPLCCVSWVLEGALHVIERPWMSPRLPEVFFSGAQPGPLVSWNPGETFAITIGFYPDAFAAMTGIDLSDLAGRMMPAQEILPPAFLDPCLDFPAAVRRDGAERALSALEGEIEAGWARTRPAGARPAQWLSDWTRSLVARAALSRPGRSTRQIARRVKSWTGFSQRELHGLGHTEQLYAKLHDALQKGDLDWAALAAASGFADQAHMIRRMRQHTGFTPEQLRHRASSDEAFWCYRLLGQYFARPGSTANAAMKDSA